MASKKRPKGKKYPVKTKKNAEGGGGGDTGGGGGGGPI